MSTPPGKKLILIRHAHRDILDRNLDNGLSEKGQKQSHLLAQELCTEFPLQSSVLYSSPKLRCIQTLSPLAQNLRQVIHPDPLLDERLPHESETRFEHRIRSFFLFWKTQDIPITVICSHGDWLPIAVHQLSSTLVDFDKGEWMEMSWNQNQNQPQLRFKK